ncbi:MAG: hypothetical protein KC912_24055 [Proteobacteria bacterium]|nr:hypothetical protein [Pseudomonadota bacterium]
MKRALTVWLDCIARGDSHLEAVRSAAESQASSPWEVVQNAGFLARCRPEVAERDIGLTRALKVRKPGGSGVIAHIEAGQQYPVPDHGGRRARGAFDTSAAMARETVAASLRASRIPVNSGLDPACGTGAFLVAMQEAGVPDIRGTDLDELALTVARVAVPGATIERRDALQPGDFMDLVVGNPPFVPPERQNKALRTRLRTRFPWLRGRFDLVIPFAAIATETCRPGGAVGLILPAASMVQNYGAPLRRRWVERHRVAVLDGPMPFPGAAVDVVRVVLCADDGPAEIADTKVHASALLALDHVPLVRTMAPGDIGLVDKVREVSVPLNSLARVDTGVVAHGVHGSKDRVIHAEEGPGRVPYADAREFFAGTHRWLDYNPARMHRAKTPELFNGPKIVLQRLRGSGPVRAAIDEQGIFVGHTCTVVAPNSDAVPLTRLLDLVRSPLSSGVLRVEKGSRLDLYPRDVGSFPVPKAWLSDPDMPLEEAWGLDARQASRLTQLGVGT